MSIEWNRVTWYSKVLAIIVVGAVFYLGFYLGGQVQVVEDSAPVATQSQISASSTAINKKPLASVLYTCDANKAIYANYYDGGTPPKVEPGQPPQPTGSANVTLSDGRSMTLSQTLSADGIRYANSDESVIFWSKGTGSFVMEAGAETFKNCERPKVQ